MLNMIFLRKIAQIKKSILKPAFVPNSINFVCSSSHRNKECSLWKILFFGTDDFSLESLKVLHDNSPRLVSRLDVVTASDICDIIKYATKNNIHVRKWPLDSDISEFDIGIVVSFGHLIPKNIINMFPLGMINVHGSLLPRWRGSCPIHHAIIKGDQETGVTVMKIMPEKFDIGDIILQEKVEIKPDETVLELRKRLAKCGADILLQTIERLPQILEEVKPQDNSNATYAPKLKPVLSIIKWQTMSAQDIYNLQRGLDGAFIPNAIFENKKIKLLQMSIYNNPIFTKPYEDDKPGTTIFDKKSKVLAVKCKGNTWISVQNVIVENKRPTHASEFSATYLSGRQKKKILLS